MEKEVNKWGVNFNVYADKEKFPKHYNFWIKSYQTWEDETFTIYNRFLEPEYDYIDIGSWIGPTVLYAANIARHTYAIEPNKLVFHELIKNLKLNQNIFHKVTCLNAALSSQTGIMKLYIKSSEGDSMSSILSNSEDYENYEVPSLTIEDLNNRYKLDKVNLIKIDVEGAEYDLIPSMEDYLVKHQPTLYLSIHPPYLKSKASTNYNDYIKFKTIAMLSALKSYKYVYNMKQELISNNEVLEERNFNSYLFSNEKW